MPAGGARIAGDARVAEPVAVSIEVVDLDRATREQSERATDEEASPRAFELELSSRMSALMGKKRVRLVSMVDQMPK